LASEGVWEWNTQPTCFYSLQFLILNALQIRDSNFLPQIPFFILPTPPGLRDMRAKRTRKPRRIRRHNIDRLEDRAMLAANFVVNTTADTIDISPGDGVALDGQGNTSLRAAIMEANALAGADTITLGPGIYQHDPASLKISPFVVTWTSRKV